MCLPGAYKHKRYMSADYILDIISSFSGVLPLIAILYNYKQLDKILRVVAVFFVVSAAFDIGLWLLPVWGVHNNVPAVHIFVIVNIVFFGIIYYMAFFNKKLKMLTVILTFIAFIIGVYYTKNLEVFPSESNTASSVVFIILSLIYFYQLLNRQEFVHIEKQGLFWFNAGVLFYFAINIFLFMLFNQLPKADQPEFYIIHSVTNVIANLLYTTGLFCKPQKIV
jgi:hypothetical protein